MARKRDRLFERRWEFATKKHRVHVHGGGSAPAAEARGVVRHLHHVGIERHGIDAGELEPSPVLDRRKWPELVRASALEEEPWRFVGPPTVSHRGEQR